jgi:hypothetical protein
MALSGNRDYIQTRDNLITVALERSRTITPGETPAAARVTSAANELNLILGQWMSEGIVIHAKSEEVLPLTVATRSYTLDADILEIEDMFYRRNNTDTRMFPMTRYNYMGLPDKEETGEPVNFYQDRQLAGIELYVWPLVSFSTGYVDGSDANEYICQLDHTSEDAVTKPITGSGYDTYWESITSNIGAVAHVDETEYKSGRLHFTKIQRLQDFDTSTDNPDLKPKHYFALVDALTFALAEINDLKESTLNRMLFKAEESFQKIKNDSTERDSLSIAPEV